MKTLTSFFVLIGVLFLFSCNKDDQIETNIDSETYDQIGLNSDGNNNLGTNNPSPNDGIQYYDLEASPTPCNDGTTVFNVFILTYFINGPQKECFTFEELYGALIAAGIPIFPEAWDWATRIFHTTNHSPQFMLETATLIGASQFPGSFNGQYVAHYWNFLENENCHEGCLPPTIPPGQSVGGGCLPGKITSSNHLLRTTDGVIITPVLSNSGWVRIINTCNDPNGNFPFLVLFDDQSIEAHLSIAQWNELRLGNLDIREFWELYQYDLVAGLEEYQNAINPLTPSCYQMVEAGFRYQQLSLNNPPVWATRYTVFGSDTRLQCRSGG